MVRRAGIPWIVLVGIVTAVWGCDDINQPPIGHTVSLAISPTYQGAGGGAAQVDLLRIIIDRELTGGAFENAVDTSVTIDPGATSLEIDLEVEIRQDPQVFRITLQASMEGIVLYSGTSQVSIARSDASSTAMVEVPVSYAGPGFQALTITPRDTIVLPGGTFNLSAIAIDSLGNAIPAPIVTYSLLNPADAAQMSVTSAGVVAVSPTALTGEVIVVAETPDSLMDQALIQIGDFQARRRWVVNPSAAQPYPTQWGTDTYPFSTINRGLQRAGIRDTVFVHVARYTETLSGDRPVILWGDSNATGVPTLESPGPSGAILSPTGQVDIRRMRFANTMGPLTVRGTAVNLMSLEFDSIVGPALTVRQSGRTTIDGLQIDQVTGGPAGRGLQITQSAGLVLRNADISNTEDAGVRADSMGYVHIAAIEVEQSGLANDTVFGIEVAFSDSVTIDSVKVHDTNGGGIGVGGATILTARGDSIFKTHMNAVEPNGFTDRSAFFAQDILVGRIVESSLFDNTAAGVFALFTQIDGNLAIDSNTISGDYWGIRGFNLSGSTTTGRVSATGNMITGRHTGPQTRAIGLGPLRDMIVSGNHIDSVAGEAIFPAPGDSVLIRGNTLLNVLPVVGGSAISVGATRAAQVDSNLVHCADTSDAIGIFSFDGPGTIDFNTVQGCQIGGLANTDLGQHDLFIRSNVFTTSQAPAVPVVGFQVQGSGYHVEMRQNQVSGGAYSANGGLVVLGNSSSMRNATIIGNTVQSASGRGIVVTFVDTAIVDSNTVSFMDSVPGITVPAMQIVDLLTFGRFRYNQLMNNATPGFYFSSRTGNTRVDSNTVSNNYGPGLWLNNGTLGVDSVIATFNLFSGQVTWGVLVANMAGSFQNNDFAGNAIGLDNQHTSYIVDATQSYWNSSLGPVCNPPLTGCDPGATGDLVSGSLVGSVIFNPISQVPNVIPGSPAARLSRPSAAPQPPPAVAWLIPGGTAPRIDGETMGIGGGRAANRFTRLRGYPQ